jgi:hypothetical protein
MVQFVSTNSTTSSTALASEIVNSNIKPRTFNPEKPIRRATGDKQLGDIASYVG